MYESGAMVPFVQMFPDPGFEETRVIAPFKNRKPAGDSYGLLEVYCIAPDCDCRRLLLNVIRESDGAHLATVSWAFDEGADERGPFLDPFNPQSEFSKDLLGLVGGVLKDAIYAARLEAHYRRVKEAVSDPGHAVHAVLKEMPREAGVPGLSKAEIAALGDPDLVDLWKEAGLNVPPTLLNETLARGARMAPLLGPLLVDGDLWLEDLESDEGWTPIHALMLLTAIGGAVVAPYAAEFLTRGLGDDWLTEMGAQLAFSLGPQGVPALWAVVVDEEADEWGRAVAIGGLSMLGLAHEGLRPGLADRMRSLTEVLLSRPDRKGTESDPTVLDALLDALAELHDEPSKALIERAFGDRRFDLHPPNKAEMLGLYDVPFEKILKEELRNPRDHFTPRRLKELGESSGPWSEKGEEEFVPPPLVRVSKVGRNDPCPCGSGKKHKKCCLSS